MRAVGGDGATPGCAGGETVDVQVVFLQDRTRIVTFQVARLVADDAVAQHQVLRPRGGGNGVRLHKAKHRNSCRQRCRWEKCIRDCAAAQFVNR